MGKSAQHNKEQFMQLMHISMQLILVRFKHFKSDTSCPNKDTTSKASLFNYIVDLRELPLCPNIHMFHRARASCKHSTHHPTTLPEFTTLDSSTTPAPISIHSNPMVAKTDQLNFGRMGVKKEGARQSHGRITTTQPFLIGHNAVTRMNVRDFSAPVQYRSTF